MGILEHQGEPERSWIASVLPTIRPEPARRNCNQRSIERSTAKGTIRTPQNPGRELHRSNKESSTTTSKHESGVIVLASSAVFISCSQDREAKRNPFLHTRWKWLTICRRRFLVSSVNGPKGFQNCSGIFEVAW